MGAMTGVCFAWLSGSDLVCSWVSVGRMESGGEKQPCGSATSTRRQLGDLGTGGQKGHSRAELYRTQSCGTSHELLKRALSFLAMRSSFPWIHCFEMNIHGCFLAKRKFG